MLSRWYTQRIFPAHSIQLYMYAICSYRQMVKVMEVMRQFFGPILLWIIEDLPSHATIEDCIEKASLATLRSKTQSLNSTYALILV